METVLHFLSPEVVVGAVVIAEQGASPALTELPTLEPAAGGVLVRVEGSSLNGYATDIVPAVRRSA